MQNICLQVFFHPKMYQPSRYLGTETGHQRTLLTGRKKSHGFQQVATLWDSLGSMRWNFFTPRSQTCHLAAASGVPKVSKAWPQLASRCSNKSWQETRVQRSGPMLPDAVVAVDPGIQRFFVATMVVNLDEEIELDQTWCIVTVRMRMHWYDFHDFRVHVLNLGYILHVLSSWWHSNIK